MSLEAYNFTAFVTDNVQSQTWEISLSPRNVSTTAQPQSVMVYSWPMFAPEESRLVSSIPASASVAPAQSGRTEILIPKRDLATFDERRGKWVLHEGIYMFEIKQSKAPSAGRGIVKQVSVVGNMEWDQ